MTLERVSVRAQIRAWLRVRMEDTDKVDVTELMPELVDTLRQDETFVRQFLTEELYPHAVQMARAIMAQGRNRKDIVAAGGIVQTRRTFEEEAESKTFDYSLWWEHAAGQYIRLTTMNRAQMLAAIDEQAKGVRTQRISLKFKAKIAERLPEDDPDVVVEDVLTNAELDQLYAEATAAIDREGPA